MYDYTPYMYRSRKREKMKKTRKNYDENDPISAIQFYCFISNQFIGK